MIDWFNSTPLDFWTLLAYLLILIGLAGTVIPVVPGPSLIWLGIFTWAWADNFQQIGWRFLGITGLLAALAWILDFVLGPMLSRRAGASWRAIVGGIVGGLLGGAFLSFIPIAGTIGGALIGAIVGMWLVEYNMQGDGRIATRIVRAYVVGMLLNTLLEVLIALLMVGLFAWQLWGQN